MRNDPRPVLIATFLLSFWSWAASSPGQEGVLVSKRARDLGRCRGHLRALEGADFTWTSPAGDMTGLSPDEPGIRIDDFSVQYAGEAFNVGDRTTFTLAGAVSFGEYSAESGSLEIVVKQAADPDPRLGLPPMIHWSAPSTEGTEASTMDFRLVVPILAWQPGSASLDAQVKARGPLVRYRYSFEVETEIENTTLEIGEPYEASLLGPYPGVVTHGERTVAGIQVDIRTMADGVARWGTRVDGTYVRDVSVDGVANPDSEGQLIVHSKSKSHDGCAYGPPHPARARIPFEDNGLITRVDLGPICSYNQSWTFQDVEAFDHPLDPPECDEGKTYDPEACDCVPDDHAVLLLEVSGDGDDSFLPGGVDGIGPGSGAVCGDDRAEPGERCDGADLEGMACDDFGFDGGELRCDPFCGGFDTSECVSDEPPPAPICGDGTIDPGEACDGADLGGQTCQTLGFDGGALSCNAGCDFDTSGCTNQPPPPVCGNGILESGEECDGSDLGGQTCSDFGFDQGSLSCTGQCTIDTSDCSSAPQECALGFEDGERVPTGGNCGCGTLTASCSNPNRVRLRSDGCDVTCVAGGDCGDDNEINGIPAHSCTCTSQGCDCSNPQGGTCSMTFQ